MLLEEVAFRFKNLASRRELKYFLTGPASETTIANADERLSAQFPQQVRSFYEHYNGLRVEDPQLEILPVEEIEFGR